MQPLILLELRAYVIDVLGATVTGRGLCRARRLWVTSRPSDRRL